MRIRGTLASTRRKGVVAALKAVQATLPPRGGVMPLASVANFTRIPDRELAGIGEALARVRQGAEADRTLALSRAFRARMQVEPVGFLHLERVGFTPAGIERGELIHSLPLAPDEEVNITHREWSNTSEEFQKIVTDSLENFSETGVSEKAEMAQSTSSQSQHSSGFNTGVSASGEYGGVNFSVTSAVNISDSANSSAQLSRDHTSTTTSKAAARTKQEHKVSFRVASAAGTEDSAVRRIHNPFTDRATRVDFYQLVRKWRVDLYRYGIRLTYDITIPEPGADILSRINEINELRRQLAEPFSFPFVPSDITTLTFADLMKRYGVALDAPPDPNPPAAIFATTRDSLGRKPGVVELDVVIPDGYCIRDNWLGIDGSGAIGGRNVYVVLTSINTWGPPNTPIYQQVPELNDRAGKFPLVVIYNGYDDIAVQLNCTLRLLPQAVLSWQQKAWAALRDAAQSQYYESRQMTKDRIADLTAEIGGQDPLSLRKIEREEIMKGVLRWMFGPGFEFFPPGILASGPPGSAPPSLYDSNTQAVKDASTWSQLLASGDLVKFLQHAIEWENMLYILYPYFWDDPTHWEDRKYLAHPDLLRSVFLKAGRARVVLTIRPGFEDAFVGWLETGQIYSPQPLPYTTIAQEMEAFSSTNYPGIPAADAMRDLRPLITRRQRQAWDEMQAVMGALESYKTQNGAYPTTAQGLASLGAGAPGPDPWGNPYSYSCPGDHGDYDLVSYGSDGQPGRGPDPESADITSWAEGSLVGSWFEYTPTTAMDIAFDEDTMPES